MRGETILVKCQRCKDQFYAHVADRKRGWGKFCSKSCKAIRQAYGRDCFKPPAANYTKELPEWLVQELKYEEILRECTPIDDEWR